MKTIALGDTHGRTIWKKILNKESDFDRVVFIGDFPDSFEIPAEDQVENLRDILKFKEDNRDKVICLVGNHDFHYMDVTEVYSGFQSGMQWIYKEIYKEAVQMKLLQMAHLEGNILFTHAGVSNTWINNQAKRYDLELTQPIDENINYLWEVSNNPFKFNGRDPYGDDTIQGPLWIREYSLLRDMYPLTQVVGHTQKPVIFNHSKDKKYPLWMIDSLGSKNYLVIEDGVIKSRKLL